MQLKSGTHLQNGKYKIERVLGQGGFGITYLATQELLDRKVCIKEFFFKEYCDRTPTGSVISTTSSNKELVMRFLNKFIKEARTISRLDHSNIIRILDVFEENGTAYYVMEYIDGCSLEDKVNRQGVLNENEAVEYVKQVGNALDYIHQNRINHLDVKPANIMIRKSDNKAILIDFGVSKQYDEQGGQTSTTPVGISYGYAPLEQYRPGGVSEFSPQADIYSLGATLYRLLTGKIPPQAMEILNDGLPDAIDKFSSHVKEAIKQSMQVRRQERPSSIGSFVSFLKNDNKKITEKYSAINPTLSTNESLELAQTYFEKAENIKYEEDGKPEDYFPFYLKAANLGHVEAQLEVGKAYEYGCGVEMDEEKAFEWYKKAAEVENADALDLLAECYDEGIGTKKNKVKAFETYNKAFVLYLQDAENDNEGAMNMVAHYYRNGLGVPKDPEKVFEWTKKCADNNIVDEIAYLAFYYEIGYGIEQDVSKAHELYAKVVDMSNAGELYDIANYFAISDNKKEKEQVHKWYSLAAEKGDVKIIADIAKDYINGYNIEKDSQKGIEYFEKAIRLGDVECMVDLGFYYYWGHEFKKNYANAIELFKKALELGSDDELKGINQWNKDGVFSILKAIAWMYREGGYGIEKNMSESSKWELRAEKTSNKNNQDNIIITTDEITKMIEPNYKKPIFNKERFIEIIEDVLGVDSEEVVETASFTNDLGADSLDAMHLVIVFEEEFKIRIYENQIEKINTVGDAILFLKKAIEEAN